MDHFSLRNGVSVCSNIGAFSGENVTVKGSCQPRVNVIFRIFFQSAASMGSHCQTENRLVYAVIRPAIFVVVLHNILIFCINRIADCTFANEIQAAVNGWFPVDLAFIFTNGFFPKEAVLRINWEVLATCGEIICSTEIFPIAIQVCIGQTVCVDKNRFIIWGTNQ